MKNPILTKILTTILVIGIFSFSIPVRVGALDISTEDAEKLGGGSIKTSQTINETGTQFNTRAGVNTTSNTSDNVPRAIPVNDAQANTYNSDTSKATGAKTSTSGAVSDALGCSASSLLGQAVATGLKSLVSSAVGGVTGSGTNDVPVSSQSSTDGFAAIKAAAEADASTNAFQQVFGMSIGASFNGIAFCIVNGLITYIADSTIAWANSGFQGNPAFIENTGNFLQGLADRQASEFIGALAYNRTGLNVCEPFRVDLAIALSESYGNLNQAGVNPQRISCSMDQIGQNFQNFANGGGIGDANIGGYWSNWNQMRKNENNPWGAYIEAGDYLKAQISAQQNTAKFELGLNNGYLNFEKCEDPAAAKKGDKKSCKTYTPGSLIQSSLQDTLNIPKERLVRAEKIDQVITALANALIKKALNKVLEK